MSLGFRRGTEEQDGIDQRINSVMRVPIRVLGIPLAFVFLATSAVWSGGMHNNHAVAALVARGTLLAICTVGTSISVLRRGPVYHWLRPESGPRRRGLILLLLDFAVFWAWFPVWMIWPHAFLSRTLTAFCDYVFRRCYNA